MRTEQRKRDSPPEETSVLFWVNYDGFPISSHVWNRMFDHCVKVQPDFDAEIRNIRNEANPSSVSFISADLAAEKPTLFSLSEGHGDHSVQPYQSSA